MSAKERERLKIFARVKRGELRQKEAAGLCQARVSIFAAAIPTILPARRSRVSAPGPGAAIESSQADKPSWTIEGLQASIYAALGEEEQALVLPEEAWAKGDLDLRLHWHRLPELAPLRNLPAFRRLVGDTKPR